MMDFETIETRREQLQIPYVRLCQQAAVSERSYRYGRRGHQLGNRILGRLSGALQGEIGGPPSSWQVALTWLTDKFGIDIRVLHEQPKRRATRDPDFMMAADVRGAACWILNAVGYTRSQIAPIVGISRQAVHSAIRRFEDANDERSRKIRARVDEVSQQIAAVRRVGWTEQ